MLSNCRCGVTGSVQVRRENEERGAWQIRKRLLYCIKINRTSLDHLLLGKKADVDKMSSAPSIARERGDFSTSVDILVEE
jgi:hypothetical protein